MSVETDSRYVCQGVVCCPASDYIQRVLSVSRPRSDGSVETRRLTHLHYLVWKDFMAPEYPTGILRFIGRVNHMYSLEMGPILVHCRLVDRLKQLQLVSWLLGWMTYVSGSSYQS